MSSHHRPLAAGLMALSMLLLLERQAGACLDTPPDHVSACSDSVRIASGSEVPASLPAFYWSPTFAASEVDKAGGRLVRTDLPSPEDVPFTVSEAVGGLWVEPAVPLVSGGTYTFTRTAICQFGGPAVTRQVTTSFRAGPATPLGKSFGTLRVTASITKDSTYVIAPTSCGGGAEHAVTARSVTVAPAADATILPLLPFVPVYRVRLDGDDRFSYGLPLDGNRLELQAYCGPADETANSPITPSKHTVQLFATYPGGSEVVLSESVEVDLSCSAASGSSSSAPAPGESAAVGCTVSRGTPASGVGGGLAVALGALIALRARRRRP